MGKIFLLLRIFTLVMVPHWSPNRWYTDAGEGLVFLGNVTRQRNLSHASYLVASERYVELLVCVSLWVCVQLAHA